MTDECVVLEGVEAQLLEAAFLERQAAWDAANARFAERTMMIRQSRGISDGVRVDFTVDGSQALMRVTG